MLSPEMSRRLDYLLAARAKGLFAQDDEFAEHLGILITADNLEAVLNHLPPNLLPAIRRRLDLDNRRFVDEQHLHPEASPLDNATLFSEYYGKVAAALLEPDSPQRRGLVSVVCLPSFEVEWALRLLGSEKKGFVLALNVAETQIWSTQAAESVEMRQTQAPIVAELAKMICEVWRKMLLRVRHPRSKVVGLDGVTYHFASHGPGVGFMAGKTWSPDSETAPGRLVALSHLLHRYVEQPDDERKEMSEAIRQAVEWFEKLP